MFIKEYFRREKLFKTIGEKNEGENRINNTKEICKKERY
jgi:hypothetical protein